MKRCATSVSVSEIPIQIDNYDFILKNGQKLKSVLPSVGEDVGCLELLYTVVKV